MNCWVGYPTGGILAIGIQVVAYQVLQPAGIQVESLSQTVRPVGLALGRVGFALAILGIVAAVFDSTIETRCPPATPSPTTSDGPGAKPRGRPTPAASIPCC